MKLSTYLQSVLSMAFPGPQRRRRALPALRSEYLESRRLLTGNVDVRMVGRDAHFYGDDLNNSVEIVAEDGNLVVRGLGETTINGSSGDLVLVSGSTAVPRDLIAFLKYGNNQLQVGPGVTVGRDAVLRSGSGSDSLGVVGATVGRNLRVDSGHGADGISVQDSTIGRSAYVVASGFDVVVNVSTSTIGDDLEIRTGNGADCIVINDVNVADDTRIFSHKGNDDLVIMNSTLGNDLFISSGAGSDLVVLDSSTVRDRSRLFLSEGQDNVVFAGSGVFGDTMRIFGGRGSDLADVNSETSFRRLKFRSITGGTVDPSLLEERITDAETGALAKAEALVELFAPVASVLEIQITPQSVSESAGAEAAELTVTRTGPVDEALVVTLTSSNPNKATVPATVTIPAGEASTLVSVAAVNNDLADADAQVTITAAASEFAAVTTLLTVTNDDAAALSLSSDLSTVVEDAGEDAVTFTLSRNTADITQPLVVNVSSAFSSRLTVPASVTIPADAASVTFTGTAIDNEVVDGDVEVTVTATTESFTAAETQITVTDDDIASLAATLNISSVSESALPGTAVLTVTRNTVDNSLPLLVTLTPSDDSRLTVPATVTIPADAASVEVDLSTIDNEIEDGDINITIDVTATGFAAGSATLTVTDDDAAVLSVVPSSSTVQESAGDEGLSITVTRSMVLNSDQTIDLSYSPDSKLSGPATVVILAGQTSVEFFVDVIDDQIPGADVAVTITASATGVTSGSTTVLVVDDDQVSLTTDISANTFAASNDTVITKESEFVISGSTTPGAAVSVDRDGDGLFDDASAIADTDGIYELTVNLLHDDVNRGAHTLTVRSIFGEETAATMALNVHYAIGTVVRFETNLGAYDVELLDDDAPMTVANFLNYVESSAYENLMVHRSVENFVIQGGGFTVNSSQIAQVTTNTAIQNEFNSDNPNVRGTLSMALLSGAPNSGTSQWFINTVNNSSLNAAQHTVFGRVIGSGMLVVDQINGLTPYDLVDLYDDVSLGEVPLLNFNPGNVTLSGTVSLTLGSAVVAGTDTQFTSQLQPGDSLQVANFLMFVQSIESDTSLTLTFDAPFTIPGVTAQTDVAPDPADFVVFSNIGELLSGL